MLKLMKLEMRKFRIGSYIRAAMIANIIIIGFICLISLVEDGMLDEVPKGMPFVDYDMAFYVIDTLVRATYIVFASVLISRIVIDEFRNKSITVLFMYPINRKKLIAAKLLVVMLFTFVAVIVGNLIVGIGFYIVNLYASIIPEPITWSLAAKELSKVTMGALATSFLSLIPLYFGMRKHSGPATIVSSLIVVAIICQNIDGFTLYSIVAVPIGMALLGAAIAYMSIRNIEHVDVLN